LVKRVVGVAHTKDRPGIMHSTKIFNEDLNGLGPDVRLRERKGMV